MNHLIIKFLHRILAAFVLISLCVSISWAQEEVKKYEDFDPANFDANSTNITNSWFNLKPGTRSVYAGTTLDDNGVMQQHRVVINVTSLTKKIAGVNTLATWDLDYSAGELVEAELAFYAQDKKGNVWRMGEYPEEYENGEFADAPAWFCGVQEAIAGISMLANPWEGTPSYSQGWAPKVNFTDRGEVDKMGETICVPMGCYENVLVISETSEDEPGAFQLKYWVEGVGNVQVGFKGGDATQEILRLVDIYKLGAEGLKWMNSEALKLEALAYSRRGSKKVYGQTPPCIPLTEIR
ncbi:MAG: hypothetical protein AAFW00_10480 [Bacteroidota bacterium]